jgi:hypothetical protein
MCRVKDLLLEKSMCFKKPFFLSGPYVTKLLRPLFINVYNMLDFSRGSSFQSSLMFVGKDPTVEHRSSTLGRTLNIRLGWRGLLGKTTLANDEHC